MLLQRSSWSYAQCSKCNGKKSTERLTLRVIGHDFTNPNSFNGCDRPCSVQLSNGVQFPVAAVGFGVFDCWHSRCTLTDTYITGCDMTVLLMCVATVWETMWRMNHGLGPTPTAVDGKLDDIWGVIELVFTVLFAVEVILKVIVHGWHAYWMDVTNR